MCAHVASPPRSQRNCSSRSACWVGGPPPLTSRGKAAAMPVAQDVAAAAVGATGDLAEPAGGTERTEPVAKEPGEAARPGTKRAEGAAGEVAAVAAEAGACPVAGTTGTGDLGPDGAG
jgi:hypothetical protein